MEMLGEFQSATEAVADAGIPGRQQPPAAAAGCDPPSGSVTVRRSWATGRLPRSRSSSAAITSWSAGIWTWRCGMRRWSVG